MLRTKPPRRALPSDYIYLQRTNGSSLVCGTPCMMQGQPGTLIDDLDQRVCMVRKTMRDSAEVPPSAPRGTVFGHQACVSRLLSSFRPWVRLGRDLTGGRGAQNRKQKNNPWGPTGVYSCDASLAITSIALTEAEGPSPSMMQQNYRPQSAVYWRPPPSSLKVR